MKTCGKCGVSKPISDFYVNRSRGGHQHRCKPCAKKSAISWQKSNPTLLNEHQLKYRSAHRDDYARRTAAWYLKNKKKNNENSAAWYKRHPERGAMKAAKYRVSKTSQTPKWANEFFMSEAYALAQLRTKVISYPWHVDHVVPLKSKIVCGLHWEGNMQVIPGSRNSTKGNRVWPDMP